MIVSLLEIFTEYMSIVFCMHKAARKKIVLDKYIIFFYGINLISILVSYKYEHMYSWSRILVLINLFMYGKARLCDKWIEAGKVFGIMLITIPSLQLVLYFGTKFIYESLISEKASGILINCIICMMLFLWNPEKLNPIARVVKKYGKLLLFCIFFVFFAYLLYTYYRLEVLIPQLVIQSFSGIIGLGVLLGLWLNTENEKKHKEKEIQAYEIYNKTFEEAVTAIRARQHEFDNHINAIKCLQLTIDNPEELVKAQNEYCNQILNDNSFNRLLKLNANPILVGFLYSKFMSAKEQGIVVFHEIHSIKYKKIIEIYELIEVIGILLDNAVEALGETSEENKVLIVKLLQEDEKNFSIEVSNSSCKYLNCEIEKFCINGYSTKGEKRGFGLTRVKEIVKKYKADIFIENVDYNGENYLRFKIMLMQNK